MSSLEKCVMRIQVMVINRSTRQKIKDIKAKSVWVPVDEQNNNLSIDDAIARIEPLFFPNGKALQLQQQRRSDEEKRQIKLQQRRDYYARNYKQKEAKQNRAPTASKKPEHKQSLDINALRNEIPWD